MRFEIASASLSILYNYIDIAMHCNLTYENSNITASCCLFYTYTRYIYVHLTSIVDI